MAPLWKLRPVLLAILTLVTAACARPVSDFSGSAAPAAGPLRPSNAQLMEAYGRIPLHFEENRGQAAPGVRFVARASGGSVLLDARGFVLALDGTAVRLTFAGGAPAPRTEALDPLPGRVNYYVGADPAAWRTGVPTFARVRYAEVYPGIDVVVYGNQRRLEYDFVVAPGADPRRIRLEIGGADRVSLDASGDLSIVRGGETVVQHAPVLYQERDGRREPVTGRYVLRGRHEVAFAIGPYDRSRPLVIDPVLAYSTRIGPGEGKVVAVDMSGNAFVAGTTTSTAYPTQNPIMTKTVSGFPDVVVTKLNPTGTALVFSTYYGGNHIDWLHAIDVDGAGNVYVGGKTRGPIPLTPGAFQSAHPPGSDSTGGWVAKFGPTGALVYSTYMQGYQHYGDSLPAGNCYHGSVDGIAVDAGGAAWLVGGTKSTDFPTTPGAYQTSPHVASPTAACGQISAPFLVKLAADGGSIEYGTYLDGTGFDDITAVALDPSGNVWVAGASSAPPFPVTADLRKPGANGAGYVLKLTPGGMPAQGTLVGPTPASLAVSAAGQAHVTGTVFLQPNPDPGEPVPGLQTVNPIQPDPAGGWKGWAGKLNAAGTAWVWSTYVGGSGVDQLTSIALDGDGNAWLAGYTTSNDFPTKDGVRAKAQNEEAVVLELSPAGVLVFGSYLGAGQAWGVTVGTDGVFVAGHALADFPVTAGAYNTAPSAGPDVFVIKLGQGGDTTKPSVSITSPANGAWTGNSINVVASATDDVGLAKIDVWAKGGVIFTIQCPNAPKSCTAGQWWSTGPLPAGAYEVQAVATDTSGNTTTSLKVTIYKDATTPVYPSGAPSGGGGPLPPLTAKLTAPANGATVSGNVAVTMTTTGNQAPTSFSLKVDNSAVLFSGQVSSATVTHTWSTTGYPNGLHTLNFTVTDGAGRTATDQITVTVSNGSPPPGEGDTTPPTVSITSPASGAWTGNSIQVNATATDNVKLFKIELWGNGGVFGTIPCSTTTCSGGVWWSTGSLPPAQYEVQAVAVDAAGNKTLSAVVKINKDATSPVKPSGASGGTTPPPGPALTASFSSPVNGATVTGTIEIAMVAGNAQGTPTQFVLKLDNGATLSSQSVSGSTASVVWNSATTTNGPHTLNLTVTDGAGRTASAAVSITVSNASPPPGGGDSTPPAVTITSPQNGDWTGNSIDVTATATDNVGLASLKFFGNGTQFAQVACGNAPTCSATEWWITGPLPSGQHTITVVAADTAGNTKTSAPVVINK